MPPITAFVAAGFEHSVANMYFLPFGLFVKSDAAFIAAAQPVTAYSIHNFKLGSAPNPDAPGANGEVIAWDATTQSATETGPGGGVMVYAPIGGADASSCATDVYATVASGGGIA